MKRTLTWAALATTLGCTHLATRPASAPTTLYFGGDILTMEGDAPSYGEALVVKDGRIAFVGEKEEAMRVAGAGATRVDLAGKTLLPGFVDGHSHFMFSLTQVTQANISSPPVGPCVDIPTTIAALRAHLEKNRIPGGEWLVGYGYDGTQLEEGRDITKADLDPAFPDHKVLLIHVSGHGAVMNSQALEFAKITRDTPTPPGGVIARMEDGREPAGLLMETAYLPAFAAIPQPDEARMLDLLRDGQMLYAANGYTLAQEGFTHVKDLRLLQKGAAEGRLFVDVTALPNFTEIDQVLGNPEEFSFGRWNHHLKLQGVKITQDGSPQGRTAYVTEPYRTGGPAGQTDWRGETTQPEAAFVRTVAAVHRAGRQIFIHANGDATIDEAIRAVELAGITAGDDARTVIIHSQFQRPDQLARYKSLGISPSYFTNHTFFWGDVHRRNIGEQKAAFISPMKAAMDLGLSVSNQSDFNVTPLDPMFILWTSMARTTRTGFVLGPDQRVDAYAGLKALTLGPAWQLGEENSRGSLVPGKLADLVILSANPVRTPTDRIRDIQVLETVKDGRTIYHRG